MTCNSCHQSEMVPTQVPRVSQGLGKLGYIIAIGAVLIVGAGVGVGLAVALDGGIDLEWSCALGFSWTLDCERVLAGGVSR